MDWTVDTSPAFIPLLTESLSELFLEDFVHTPSHRCCPRCFISPQAKQAYLTRMGKLMEEDIEYAGGVITEDRVEEMRESKGVCTCSAMELTFQVNHLLTEKKLKELIYELYFKMFQSYKFKQLLGLCFAANFEVISLERDADGNNIGQIGVQILTIDDIGLMIMRDEKLRGNITRTFGKITDLLVETDFDDEKISSAMFHVLYDLKYLARPKTLAYLLNETDFLECMLEQLPKFYYRD